MQKKLVLYISFLIILVPLIKFDIFIYPTLDYFGKYVFVLALNVFPFWITIMLFNLKNEKLKIILPLLWSVFVGVIFYLIS
jgi:predicted neutral ceramidase superfamily lipid hydrolase